MSDMTPPEPSIAEQIAAVERAARMNRFKAEHTSVRMLQCEEDERTLLRVAATLRSRAALAESVTTLERENREMKAALFFIRGHATYPPPALDPNSKPQGMQQVET